LRNSISETGFNRFTHCRVIEIYYSFVGVVLYPSPRKTGGPGGPHFFRRADAGRTDHLADLSHIAPATHYQRLQKLKLERHGNKLSPPTLFTFIRCNFLATSPQCTNVTEVRSYRGGTSLPPAGRKGRESNNAPRLFFRLVRWTAILRNITPSPFVLSPGGSMSKDETSNLCFDRLSTNGFLFQSVSSSAKSQRLHNALWQSGDRRPLTVS
jgi:hypothetical protein